MGFGVALMISSTVRGIAKATRARGSRTEGEGEKL
jgi:hypothetical protein